MTLFEEHILGVKKIQEEMRDFSARRQQVKIYHGTTNSTRAQKFERGAFVDVSELNRIIEINVEGNYALVEPNVSMDALVDATLKHKLVPPVVMEFPGITVGGGVQGGAGESSSFKYGLFHDTCLEYELVLGNGEIVTASPSQNEDLFYGTACSYGSLGIITLVKLRLIRARDYVHLTYKTVGSPSEALSLTKETIEEGTDFLDAIMFSKNRGIVMTGRFTDKNDLPISTFSKRSDEWFYLHAGAISRGHKIYEEILPIKEYLFRYDRGGFWVGRYAFSFLKIPFTRLTRYLLDRAFKTRVLYRLLHGTNLSQRYFVQDLSLPEDSALEFLSYIDDRLHIYPLWICPLKPGRHDRLSPNYLATDLVINVGVWGEVDPEYSRFLKANRDVENRVMELGGRKVLYAHQYYPKDQFWKIYDYAWYEMLRKKYFAEVVFPDLYEKTRVTEKYKLSLLSGILRGIRSPRLSISKSVDK